MNLQETIELVEKKSQEVRGMYAKYMTPTEPGFLNNGIVPYLVGGEKYSSLCSAAARVREMHFPDFPEVRNAGIFDALKLIVRRRGRPIADEVGPTMSGFKVKDPEALANLTLAARSDVFDARARKVQELFGVDLPCSGDTLLPIIYRVWTGGIHMSRVYTMPTPVYGLGLLPFALLGFDIVQIDGVFDFWMFPTPSIPQIFVSHIYWYGHGCGYRSKSTPGLIDLMFLDWLKGEKNFDVVQILGEKVSSCPGSMCPNGLSLYHVWDEQKNKLDCLVALEGDQLTGNWKGDCQL